MEEYLRETKYLNYNTSGITAMVSGIVIELSDELEIARRIYKFVRDGWRYDPYQLVLKEGAIKASSIFQRTYGNCVDKAILMVTFCRYAGIPARLCFAKVKNHIATERLEKFLKTNELVPHGIAELYLNGKWVKCTPAFNKSLCDKLGVDVLEFDGEKDSVFQQYDCEGAVFMEYLEDYGHYDDVPVRFIEKIMKQYYPHIFDEAGNIIPLEDFGR